ncbi:MAG: PilZ domain-containing protein [Sphingomonas sp.]|nr:PilZ domain-containing protein [Sphingomonas sp.]
MGSAVAYQDDRLVTREEVHYRARATGPDGQSFTMLIVNISAMGLMARCDAPYQSGDTLQIVLPVVGSVVAEIRWSLGGRFGCELTAPIELANYYDLLAILLKSS